MRRKTDEQQTGDKHERRPSLLQSVVEPHPVSLPHEPPLA
jgi:hypothetical protein